MDGTVAQLQVEVVSTFGWWTFSSKLVVLLMVDLVHH